MSAALRATLHVLIGVALLAAPASAIVFTDVTVEAGVAYRQYDAPDGPAGCLFPDFCEPERMTGGAAAGDVDGDGLPDLFVTRLDAHDLLFRNRGDGTFEDISLRAGLVPYELQSNGAALVDIDNDGDLDLYVLTLGVAGDDTNDRYYLFVNDGKGQFSEEAEARGAAVATPSAHLGTSVAVGDYDRDGYVDLHLNEWTVLADPDSHARLLHNRGSAAPGHFEDVTETAGVAPPGGRLSFSSAFRDMDDDGWPDLVIAADFGTSRLLWNQRDGTFLDGTVAAGVGTDENGMGSTVADFDGDGDLDWFVTSIHDPAETCDQPGNTCNWGYTGNRLYRNEGGRRFADGTDAAGVRAGFWGWGAAFFDSDNDGDLDLTMTNGFDIPFVSVEDAFARDPMRFWENDGTGVMSERSQPAGLVDHGSGKGLLVFDFDADGDLDVFLVNNAEGGRLFRNDGGNAGGWLRVVTKGGAGSTAQGLGARVSIVSGGTRQLREVGSASHFLGHGERVAHFGLGGGSDPVEQVAVSWPSGRQQLFRAVPRNTTLVAREVEADQEATTHELAGRWRVRIRGRGRMGGRLACPLALDADRWSLLELRGNVEPGSRPGHQRLVLDAASRRVLEASVAQEAAKAWGEAPSLRVQPDARLRLRTHSGRAPTLEARLRLYGEDGRPAGWVRLRLKAARPESQAGAGAP